MANQSIYSEQWIDLVFENRNKEYGAYQLRYENPKTTLKALGIGFMLVAFLLSISMFLNKSESGTAAVVEFLPIHPIPMSSLIFPPEKKSDLEAAPLIQKKNDKPKPEVSKSNLVDPKVTETQNAKTEIATNDEALERYVEPIEGALAKTENSGVKGGIGNAPTADTSATNGSYKGTHVTAVLDKQPAFPGGMKKFYAYVAQNFKTPQAELAKTVKV
jgi:protein TonB